MAWMPMGYQTSQGVERGTNGASQGAGLTMTGGYDPNAPLLGQQAGFAEQQANRYAGMANQADQRAAPEINRDMSWQTRQQVNQGIGMLQNQAYGRGMTPGEAMARRSMMEAQGAQMGMAASARGGPQMAALAARNAATQMQGIGAQGTLEAQRIRAQEMEAARNQMFQATSGLRGQDIGQAQFGSDLQLQNTAANDARSLQLLGMEQSTWQNQRDAMIQQQQNLLGDTSAAQDRLQRREASQYQYNQGMINRGIGVGMGAMQGIGTVYGSNQQPTDNRNTGIIRDNPYDTNSSPPPYDWKGIY